MNERSGMLAPIEAVSKPALHEARVRVVDVDPNWPDGFDLADFGDPDKPQPEGLTEETIRQLVHDAEPVKPSAEASNVVPLPGRSRERGEGAAPGLRKAQDGGLLFSSFRDGKQDWKRSCSSITLLAMTRSGEGKNWGAYVEVETVDGTRHRFSIPGTALAGSRSDEWRKLLAYHGCRIEPGAEAGNALLRYLLMQQDLDGNPLPLAIAAAQTGWCDEGTFVTPHESVCRDASALAVYQPMMSVDTKIRRKGSLEQWQKSVATPCGEHDMTVLAISLALASPLLQWLGQQGFILHFRGGSSIGKTTLLRVAGSVWGGGGLSGPIRSWHSTGNSLGAIAPAVSETVLILDELGQADPDKVGDLAYHLSDGMPRERATVTGDLTSSLSWWLVILSSGEISLEDKLRESRKLLRLRAGQAARFIDLFADTGSGFGIFDAAPAPPDRANATKQDCGAALSSSLRSATEADFGHLGPEFVRAIIHSDNWTSTAKRIIDDFVSSVAAGTNGQVQRVARSFGLIAAAGELAISFGLLPWPEGRAITAAKVTFSRWLDARGHSGASEEHEAVNILRGVISKDAARFQDITKRGPIGPLGPPNDDEKSTFAPSNRLGFREQEDDKQYYLVPKETWEQLFAGHNPAGAAKKLLALGVLAPSADGRPMIQRSLPGLGKKCRVYCVDACRLFDDSIVGGAANG